MIQIFTFFFFLWGVFSLVHIYFVYKGKKVNEYLYNSIPNVFTSIGILGTFLGIYIALQNFDVDNIEDSIETLLMGLKGAFMTSIVGIILSILFGRLSDLVAGSKKENYDNNDFELMQSINENLNKINDTLVENNSKDASYFKKVENKIEEAKGQLSGTLNEIYVYIGDTLIKNHKEKSEIFKMIQKDINEKIIDQQAELVNLVRYNSNENRKEHKQRSEELDAQYNALIKYHEQLHEDLIKSNDAVDKTKSALLEKQEEISEKQLSKFDELSQIISENNVKALVEVMERVTEEFNNQMSDLINKLVQENFKELNNSVQQLNTWQQENKLMVEDLTNKYQKTTEEFKSAAEAIKNISYVTGIIYENTSKITDENSKLNELLDKFKAIMIDDTRFERSSKNILEGIDQIKDNIDAFDKTTNKLNEWVDKEQGVKQSTEALLIKLDDLAKIKAYDGEFWNETKRKLDEGLNTVTKASKSLSNDLDNVNEEYQKQLTQLLENLDELIQRIIQNYDLKNK